MINIKRTDHVYVSLLIACFLLSVNGAFSQKIVKVEKVTDHSVRVKGNNFDGVIFTNGKINTDLFFIYDENNKPINRDSFIDLTTGEVLAAEKMLRNKLDQVLVTYPNTAYNVNFVKKHLKKYFRQYVGYINDKNERIMYINCFWDTKPFELYNVLHKSDEIPDWQKQFQLTLDGGNHYWRIQINLSNGQAFEFGVNGEG